MNRLHDFYAFLAATRVVKRPMWLLKAVLVAALFLPAAAQAQYCSAAPNPPAGRNVSTTLPTNVVVRPGDAAGTSYFTVTANLPGYTYAQCGPGGRSTDVIQFGLLASSTDGVWPSGVTGLGWRVLRGGTAFTAPASRTIGPGNVASTATTWSLQLVRTTGALGTGTIAPPYIRGSFTTGTSTIVVYWLWTTTGTIRLSVPTCSVAGTTINIGEVETNALPNVASVSATSAASNVRLTCANGPRVDMRLTTAIIANSPNVIAVPAVTGGARGVGVQLIYNNAVMAYNTNYRVTNSATATQNVPIAARYYRTGNLEPGAANTSAVLQFTYP